MSKARAETSNGGILRYADLGITRGRSFRSGDVVLLRSTHPMERHTAEFMQAQLAGITKDTGVKFVLFDSSIEIVERTDEEPETALD